MLIPLRPGGTPYCPPCGFPCVPPAAIVNVLVAGHDGVSSVVPTAESASFAPSSPDEARTVQPLILAMLKVLSAVCFMEWSTVLAGHGTTEQPTRSSGSPKLCDMMLPLRLVCCTTA